MTQPAALCPNCGAPVSFRWSSSVQTTCDHCRSILVRTDLNLELVGVVADLPPDSSPIQIGTEGNYKGRNFTVAGRIIYSYPEGSWNEWHLVLADGTSGWLSDAQSQYALTFRTDAPNLPQPMSAPVGSKFSWQNTEFAVTTITIARYRGVEGELPFQYWGKEKATFIDLLSVDGKFATLDYVDAETALYLGELVDFASLNFRNLKVADNVAASASGGLQTRGLSCPGCGAALTIQALGRTVTVVCANCHSILDATDPNLQILQRFKVKADEEIPLIPLGSIGKWRGATYNVIGFQRRTGSADDESFSWREYVLYNPSKGFRYFTEYNGHWNDATPVTALPQQNGEVKYLGTSYSHFQTVTVRTSFVLGEFPWQVRVDDAVEVSDYIDPPHVLSAEKTAGEVTWSLSDYVYGKDIWKAFQLEGLPPTPVGVFENQPSPSRASLSYIWLAFAAFVSIILIILLVDLNFAQNTEVYRDRYHFRQSTAESSFVTPYFQLTGRTSNVEIRTQASLYNQWIYLNYALINADSGQAFDLGREVSYYTGSDSDGVWTEGNTSDTVLLPAVPPGRYYLRVEPESEALLGDIYYTIIVNRDVPSYELYLIALGALIVPALLISWRTFNFEQLRWAESDHPNISIFHGGL